MGVVVTVSRMRYLPSGALTISCRMPTPESPGDGDAPSASSSVGTSSLESRGQNCIHGSYSFPQTAQRFTVDRSPLEASEREYPSCGPLVQNGSVSPWNYSEA